MKAPPTREGGGVDAGDPQGQDHHRRHREEADQEAERAGGRRVEAAVERRGEAAHQPVGRGRADDDQDRDGADPHPLAVAGQRAAGGCSRRPGSPPAPASATSRPPTALRDIRGASSSPRPSECQAWLRVSNSSRGSLGRRGRGHQAPLPGSRPAYASGGGASSAAQRGQRLVPGAVDRDRELQAGDLQHPPDLVVVRCRSRPGRCPRRRRLSRRCQARTIRAIPVESMNSHSVRSIRTEASPDAMASSSGPSRSGAVLRSSSPRTAIDADSVARAGRRSPRMGPDSRADATAAIGAVHGRRFAPAGQG